MTTSSGPTVEPALPGWVRRTTAWCGAALVVGLTAWLVSVLLLRVALVSFSLLVAVLLTALLAPVSERLRRVGLPGWLAALLSLLVIVATPVGTGLLLYTRLTAQLSSLGPALTGGIDALRSRLTDGPLHLEERQVDQLRDAAVGALQSAAPSPTSGAMTALRLLGAAVFVLFAVFFLLKDGAAMWRWVLRWTPAAHRDRADGAGRTAWSTLGSYVKGTTVIALVDATLIGGALLVLGVPLWLSLTLLTFLAAYVPLLGATVAGVGAVLVTLVTNGGGDALLVLVVVLLVQQVEGNVLQPMVTGRAVRLHPLVILTAVTCGTLLLGIIGAVVAVPVVAVGYRVAAHLAEPRPDVEPDPDAQPDPDAEQDLATRSVTSAQPGTAAPATPDAPSDPDPASNATASSRAGRPAPRSCQEVEGQLARSRAGPVA